MINKKLLTQRINEKLEEKDFLNNQWVKEVGTMINLMPSQKGRLRMYGKVLDLFRKEIMNLTYELDNIKLDQLKQNIDKEL